MKIMFKVKVTHPINLFKGDSEFILSINAT